MRGRNWSVNSEALLIPSGLTEDYRHGRDGILPLLSMNSSSKDPVFTARLGRKAWVPRRQ
jgi:hypothetical protein